MGIFAATYLLQTGAVIRGLMRELLYHAKKGYTINPLVMFSGPHRASLLMVIQDSC
ncbi:hypothetical protein VE00_10504 [Pseudogymnoascus sp. WSF 3629]|nr:hypothetical protein VE00_10504 [Pseudogymnoascus sp. WSF 3629]